MDWRTILAVVLSVVLIVAALTLRPVVFPPKQAVQTTQSSTPAASASTAAGQQAASGTPQATSPPAATQPGSCRSAPVGTGRVVADPAGAQAPSGQPALVVRETDLFTLTFETAGADVSSVRLKEFRNVDGSGVELVFAAESEERPFALAFGDHLAAPENGPFALREYREGARRMFEFSKPMLSATGVPFTLKKTYVVMDGEYLVELKVAIENSVNDVPAIDTAGISYTLLVGPQIGPPFKKLDNRNDPRSFVYYWLNDKGKIEPKKEVLAGGKTKTIDQQVRWAGVIGKYFTIIAVPPGDVAKLVLDSRFVVPGKARNALAFSRSTVRASRIEDVWQFYLGPMKAEFMERYNKADGNGFGIRDLMIDQAIDKPGDPRADRLAAAAAAGAVPEAHPELGRGHHPGHPGHQDRVPAPDVQELGEHGEDGRAQPEDAGDPHPAEGQAREDEPGDRGAVQEGEGEPALGLPAPAAADPDLLRALQPAQHAVRAARRDVHPRVDPRPLGPRERVHAAHDPIFGFLTDIRMLPLIMLGTQLLSSKIMQPPSADASGAQMKMLNYLMPVVFLFMLYNMPSGLTLYWTVQNILSIVQQVYINWTKRRKTAVQAPA